MIEHIKELKEALSKEHIFPKVSVLVEEWGIEMDYYRSLGRWCVDYDERFFSPPDIPTDLIEKVTLQDRIYRGLRTEGVYRHEGAELVVTTQVQMIELGSGEWTREEWQNIKASAPNAETLMTIYALVRQGNLPPVENWEAPSAQSEVIDPPKTEV